MRAWRSQGLPEGVREPNEYAYRLAGGRHEWPPGEEWLPVNSRMIPEYEEKVVERREHTQIVRDWKGNICEIANEFTVEYLRNPRDFVTRRWIRCPVESREDWKEMRRRYDPADPARFADVLAPAAARSRASGSVLALQFNGPFWQLREWLGFENLCVAFAEDPDFVKEMVSFWGDFMAAMLERIFRLAVPDVVRISEDMAFKLHAMISPAMAREFLLPVYGRWGDMIREAGCPVYSVDSDGYMAELIPVWLEAGVNACDPVEVAAGNDLPALRARHGRALAFRGGVDKRAIAAGGAAIRGEIGRLAPVIRSGGYIPGCDHAVPPDVSWPKYADYVRLLADATGWL
jgi:uroporphyrinogen decarboxylase